MTYPHPHRTAPLFYSVTDDEGEEDLTPDEALDRDTAFRLAAAHNGVVWAHGRFVASGASVRWRVST